MLQGLSLCTPKSGVPGSTPGQGTSAHEPQPTVHLLQPRTIGASGAQSCPTLRPTHCDPPGSSVHGVLQARTLEWGAIPLLQGIFPTQGSNPGLLCRKRILYRLNYRQDLPLKGPTRHKEDRRPCMPQLRSVTAK